MGGYDRDSHRSEGSRRGSRGSMSRSERSERRYRERDRRSYGESRRRSRSRSHGRRSSSSRFDRYSPSWQEKMKHVSQTPAPIPVKEEDEVDPEEAEKKKKEDILRLAKKKATILRQAQLLKAQQAQREKEKNERQQTKKKKAIHPIFANHDESPSPEPPRREHAAMPRAARPPQPPADYKMDTARRDVLYSPQKYRQGVPPPQCPPKPTVVEPPKPTDSAVLKALTQLAEHVVMKDATIEKKIYDKNLKSRGGKRFRFLYEEDSNDGKYYKWLKKKLRAKKENREMSPDIPPSQNSRSPRSANPAQNPPRKRKRRGFSATGPGGPSLPIAPLLSTSGTPSLQASMPSFRAPTLPPGHGGAQLPQLKQPRKERERRTFTEEVKIEDFDGQPLDEKSALGSSSSSLDKMEAYLKQMDRDSQRGVVSKQEVEPDRHHIGDHIPSTVLKDWEAKAGGDRGAGTLDRFESERLTQQNKGFRMLSKMGWNGTSGLGRGGRGIVNPIAAAVKDNPGGVGQAKPWDPSPDDDPFTLYKKKMMLSYQHRPNPLGNPRKAYY